MTSSRILVLFSCFLVLRIQTGSSAISKNTQLFNSLLENYDKDAAPTQANGNPTNVKISMYVIDATIIDDNSLDMSFSSYIRFNWEDPRLKYSAADNIAKWISLPEDSWKKIWIPDVFIVDAKTTRVHDFVTPNRFIRLEPSGSVFYSMKVSAVSSCFPTEQRRSFKCRLTFESYGFNADSLTVSAMANPIAISHEIVLKNAKLTSHNVSDCTQIYSSGTYSCLEYSIFFETDFSGLISLLIPSILVVIASWISFWIDHEATVARVLPGFASLATLTLIAIQKQNTTMLLSYGGLVNRWLLVCYAFVFASLLEYLLVVVLSRRKSGWKGLDFAKLTSDEEDLKSGEDGKRRALGTDWVARILFPVVFLVFVVVQIITG